MAAKKMKTTYSWKLSSTNARRKVRKGIKIDWGRKESVHSD